MREIKFRAWDKYNKRWVTNDVVFDLRTQTPMINIINSTTNNDDIILMQYTGLKDKNSKEIYEGDIIYGVWYPSFFHHIIYENAVVERGTFVIGEYSIKADTWIVNEKNLQRIPLHSLSDIEVIGNIYKNPELIKEE